MYYKNPPVILKFLSIVVVDKYFRNNFLSKHKIIILCFQDHFITVGIIFFGSQQFLQNCGEPQIISLAVYLFLSSSWQHCSTQAGEFVIG